MDVTPVALDGIVVWPEVLRPQATTVPSLLSASAWLYPAEIAVTPVNPDGIVVWPASFLPQATTVPSLLRAKEKFRPDEIAVTPFKLEGTVASPYSFCPQATTVPLLFKARQWPKTRPAEIAVTPVRLLGTVAAPNVALPQPTTVPSPLSAKAWPSPAEIAVMPSRESMPAAGSKCSERLLPNAKTDPSFRSPKDTVSVATKSTKVCASWMNEAVVVAAVVGVPVINPVVAFIASPDGSPEPVHESMVPE